MSIETTTLTFNDNATFNTGSFNGTRVNDSGYIEFYRPGEFPYIEMTVTNNTLDTVVSGVVKFTVTQDMLDDLLDHNADIQVQEFAVISSTNHVLEYWVRDSADTSNLASDALLAVGHIFYVQFITTTGDAISVASDLSDTFKLRRYATTDNKNTSSPPSITADFDLDSVYTSHHPTGTWTSPIIDLQKAPIGMHFNWIENIASTVGARVDIDIDEPQVIQYRCSDSNTGLTPVGTLPDSNSDPIAYLTAIGDWGGLTESDWEPIPENTNTPTVGRYVQFRVTLMI